MRVSAALFCLLIAVAAGASAATKLVYRVDEAIARVNGQHITIFVRGAVRSGGWEKPRLIIRRAPSAEGRDMEIAFVATPPSRLSTVVQTIVPMNVRLRMRLPPDGLATLTIVSETNSVVAEIVPKKAVQKTAGE